MASFPVTDTAFEPTSAGIFSIIMREREECGYTVYDDVV